jgi:alpha-tubulin suppressor-like RCC1 family protein
LNDTVIVTTDNQVYRTDYDSKTPIQLGITGDDIAQVDFNVDHFMILKADGTVLHFGFTEDRCDEVGDWTDILHIHCSKKASVGMDKDVVYMTGANGTSTHKLDNLAWHLESEQIAVFVTKKGIATVFPRNGSDAYDSFQLFEVIPSKAKMEKEQLQTATQIEISAQPHKSGIAWEHYQKYRYLRKRLSGGLAHCAGIMYNGTAKAVGSNNYNQCDVYDWRDMTQIVCTLCATIGLCKDGTIRHAGQIHISDTCSPGGTPLSKWPSNIKSITSFLHSDTHVVGLTEDGKAVAYGCNENGQCDLAHWRDITEIAAHYGFTAGVRKDGTVVVCGNVSTIENTVSKWTNIEHIFKGVGEQTLIGLKYDGTVVTAGMDAQFDMSGWKDIIDISVGCRAIVGLTGNGHLYVTGKASDQYLLNGIDGVLCASVQQDLLRFTRGKNDTNLLWICRDEIPEIIEFGSLEYQNGYLSSITVLETGEVIVSVFDDEVRYGQNETDDWQMLEPSPDSAPSSAAQSSSSGSASASSGGCYVATCVYGSYDCPEVWTLRRFRDDTLGSTWYGRAFIHTYYAVSPTFVKWFGETTWFKKMWRGTLDRMVQKLLDKGVENTPYEDKEW